MVVGGQLDRLALPFAKRYHPVTAKFREEEPQLEDNVLSRAGLKFFTLPRPLVIRRHKDDRKLNVGMLFEDFENRLTGYSLLPQHHCVGAAILEKLDDLRCGTIVLSMGHEHFGHNGLAYSPEQSSRPILLLAHEGNGGSRSSISLERFDGGVNGRQTGEHDDRSRSAIGLSQPETAFVR